VYFSGVSPLPVKHILGYNILTAAENAERYGKSDCHGVESALSGVRLFTDYRKSTHHG
jgi:hypothetical protein